MIQIESWDLAALFWSVALILLFAMLFASRWRARHKSHQMNTATVGTALAHVLRGNNSDARRLLEQRLAKDFTRAGSADALTGLVALMRSSGEAQRALGILESFGQKCLSATELCNLKADLYLATGDPGRAFSLLEAESGSEVALLIAAAARSGKWEEGQQLYRKRVERRAWSKETLAFLTAGAGLNFLGKGLEADARSAITKAIKLNPDGALVRLAKSLADDDADERSGFLDRAGLDWPALTPVDEARVEHDSGVEVLMADAKEAYDAGDHERAMGILRDFLDQGGKDILVRVQYVRWIVESDSPSRWRTQLSETICWLEESQGIEPFVCTVCGFESRKLLMICPNCHGVETVVKTGGEGSGVYETQVSSRGAGVLDVLSEQDLRFLRG